MATATLEFEKPIFELEKQIDELKKLAGERQLDVVKEIAPLEQKLVELREEIYKSLTPLQRVQVARSNKRPLTDDYLRLCFSDFIELHGDRAFREDAAIIGGWARLDGETVMVIGHQRGRRYLDHRAHRQGRVERHAFFLQVLLYFGQEHLALPQLEDRAHHREHDVHRPGGTSP